MAFVTEIDLAILRSEPWDLTIANSTDAQPTLPLTIDNPTGAPLVNTLRYLTGNMVIHNGDHWLCLFDGTIQEPTLAATQWVQISPDGTVDFGLAPLPGNNQLGLWRLTTGTVVTAGQFAIITGPEGNNDILRIASRNTAGGNILVDQPGGTAQLFDFVPRVAEIPAGPGGIPAAIPAIPGDNIIIGVGSSEIVGGQEVGLSHIFEVVNVERDANAAVAFVDVQITGIAQLRDLFVNGLVQATDPIITVSSELLSRRQIQTIVDAALVPAVIPTAIRLQGDNGDVLVVNVNGEDSNPLTLPTGGAGGGATVGFIPPAFDGHYGYWVPVAGPTVEPGQFTLAAAPGSTVNTRITFSSVNFAGGSQIVDLIGVTGRRLYDLAVGDSLTMSIGASEVVAGNATSFGHSVSLPILERDDTVDGQLTLTLATFSLDGLFRDQNGLTPDDVIVGLSRDVISVPTGLPQVPEVSGSYKLNLTVQQGARGFWDFTASAFVPRFRAGNFTIIEDTTPGASFTLLINRSSFVDAVGTTASNQADAIDTVEAGATVIFIDPADGMEVYRDVVSVNEPDAGTAETFRLTMESVPPAGTFVADTRYEINLGFQQGSSAFTPLADDPTIALNTAKPTAPTATGNYTLNVMEDSGLNGFWEYAGENSAASLRATGGAAGAFAAIDIVFDPTFTWQLQLNRQAFNAATGGASTNLRDAMNAITVGDVITFTAPDGTVLTDSVLFREDDVGSAEVYRMVASDPPAFVLNTRYDVTLGAVPGSVGYIHLADSSAIESIESDIARNVTAIALNTAKISLPTATPADIGQVAIVDAMGNYELGLPDSTRPVPLTDFHRLAQGGNFMNGENDGGIAFTGDVRFALKNIPGTSPTLTEIFNAVPSTDWTNVTHIVIQPRDANTDPVDLSISNMITEGDTVYFAAEANTTPGQEVTPQTNYAAFTVGVAIEDTARNYTVIPMVRLIASVGDPSVALFSYNIFTNRGSLRSAEALGMFRGEEFVEVSIGIVDHLVEQLDFPTVTQADIDNNALLRINGGNVIAPTFELIADPAPAIALEFTRVTNLLEEIGTEVGVLEDRATFLGTGGTLPTLATIGRSTDALIAGDTFLQTGVRVPQTDEDAYTFNDSPILIGFQRDARTRQTTGANHGYFFTEATRAGSVFVGNNPESRAQELVPNFGMSASNNNRGWLVDRSDDSIVQNGQRHPIIACGISQAIDDADFASGTRIGATHQPTPLYLYNTDFPFYPWNRTLNTGAGVDDYLGFRNWFHGNAGSTNSPQPTGGVNDLTRGNRGPTQSPFFVDDNSSTLLTASTNGVFAGSKIYRTPAVSERLFVYTGNTSFGQAGWIAT